MNPFLSFLILVPMVASLLMFLLCGYLFYLVGFKWEIAFGFFLTGGLCTYLIYLFKRSFNRDWAEYDVPGVDLTAKGKKSTTKLYLFLTYFVLAISSIIFFSYELMKGALGLIFFVMGISLIWSSFVVKRAVKETSGATDFGRNDEDYKKYKTIYVLLAASTGVLTFLLYMFSPSWHFISPWDIGGGLFYLACTCVWVAALDVNQWNREHERKAVSQ